jgi:hypothetical protein
MLYNLRKMPANGFIVVDNEYYKNVEYELRNGTLITNDLRIHEY